MNSALAGQRCALPLRVISFHRTIIFISGATKFYSGVAPLTGSVFGLTSGCLLVLLIYDSLFAAFNIATGVYSGSPGTYAALDQLSILKVLVPVG